MKQAPQSSPSDGLSATTAADRRVWPRIPASQLPDLSVNLTTGPDIRLIDISRGGALFECSKRLVPASTVALRLVTPDGTHIVRGRVVRSRIVRLERGGLGYQAAIAFNETLQDLKEPDASPAADAPPEPEPTPTAALWAGAVGEPAAGPGHAATAAHEPEPAPDTTTGDSADAAWTPPMLTLTASVLQTSEELREIFNGNDW
jgi:PilZ domain